MVWFARLLSSLRARWHRALGRLARRLGRPAAARAHLERALALGDDPFAARVELAALAFAAGDYARWRRLLDEARASAPERFARLDDPSLGAAPRLAGTAVAHGGADALPPERPTAARAEPEVAAFTFDDCASDRERARLRRLGPIQRDEIARCDLDDLLQRLTD